MRVFLRSSLVGYKGNIPSIIHLAAKKGYSESCDSYIEYRLDLEGVNKNERYGIPMLDAATCAGSMSRVTGLQSGGGGTNLKQIYRLHKVPKLYTPEWLREDISERNFRFM